MMNEQTVLKNILLNKTAKSLLNNGFDVVIAENSHEAAAHLTRLIPPESIIGYGGSRTLETIGFFEKFNKVDYPNILDRNNPDVSFEAKTALQRKALSADYFISSANAISSNGDLILIDKWGNRNGAMTYGPQKRIFVIGWNKIADSLEDALNRAKNQASVLNNIRFNTGNPCTIAGKCVNCNSENRICGVTTIISRCNPVKSALVLFVKEDLGF